MRVRYDEEVDVLYKWKTKMSKNKEAKKLIPLLEGYTGLGELSQDLSKLKIPDGLLGTLL